MAFPLRLRWRLWWRARLLPVAARRSGLLELLRAATPRQEDPHWHPPAGEVVGPVMAAVARPWRMRGRSCLREGLLTYYFLRLAGHPAVLHFGIEPASLGSDRMRAHCWVSVGDEVLVNAPASEPHGRQYVEILRFDGEARSVEGERLTSLPAMTFPA